MPDCFLPVKKILDYVFLVAFIAGFTGCKREQTPILNLSMLREGKVFAVPTGTVADQMVLEKFPDAQIEYYNTVLDCALAVSEGKADAAVYDQPVLKNIAAKNEGLMVLDELLMEDQYGFAVQKNNTALKDLMDEVLDSLKKEGTYQKMIDRWFPEKGNPDAMPEISFPKEKGTLRFGTAAVTEPMTFVDGTHSVAGFDIEYASYIALKAGKSLEIVNMEFGALLPALISGKVDMIGAGLSITEERSQKVLFSDSYYPSGIAALVKVSGRPFDEETPDEPVVFTGIEDILNQRIGVLLGSIHDAYASNHYPDAQIFQYQNVPDMLTALQAEKIETAFVDQLSLRDLFMHNDQLGVLEEAVYSVPIAAGFHPEDDILREQFNTFLLEINENGVYEEMVRRWMKDSNPEMPEIKGSDYNGVLRVGIVSDLGLPFTATINNQPVGFDIELTQRFAANLGKAYVPTDIQFGSMLASLSTRKIDMIACSLMITEERKKQIDFSDPYIESGVSLIALKKHLSPGTRALFSHPKDLDGKRIGVFTGTVHDAWVASHYPKAVIFRFENPSDMILSVKTQKTDAAMLDLTTATLLLKHNPELGILNDDILTLPLGFGFRKDRISLKEEFNAFLRETKENGVYDSLCHRWLIEDAEQAIMPVLETTKTEKSLVAGVAINDLPYVAYMNGEYVGLDIELLKRFAHRYKYRLEIIPMEFASLISSLAAGKVDLITDGIAITEERKKQIDFSDPYADFKTGILVLKKNMEGNHGKVDHIPQRLTFLQSLSESFYNNLLAEKRYLLIIEGLKITLLISLFATLFGTLLGGLVCFMSMSSHPILSITAKAYVSLLRGTPVLVLLMIIYYIVFASINISPVLVAIFSFGLNFAAYVSEMFRTSVESIDKGQREAGIASGFTGIQTFVYIILPQAIRRVLPVYKGEFISLVKMTSIVGYIAVQDLTKASDIIRSRTFDAFFPLIMAAVLYMAIAWMFTWVLGYIEVSADPKRYSHRSKRGGKRP